MSLEQRIENLEYKRIKSAAKAVNDADLDGVERIRIVGVKKELMVETFTAIIEFIAEKHSEDDIPEESLELYNDLYSEEKTVLDLTEEITEKRKTKEKTNRKKAAQKRTAKKEIAEKEEKIQKLQPYDEYGTRPNTLARTFVEKIKESPATMEEIKKADWNPKGFHFNDTLRRLVESEQASVDDNGVITITN